MHYAQIFHNIDVKKKLWYEYDVMKFGPFFSQAAASGSLYELSNKEDVVGNRIDIKAVAVVTG